MSIDECERLASARADANREAWRQRIEHFVALRLRLQRFDAANRECLRGHDCPAPLRHEVGDGVAQGSHRDGASRPRRATTRTAPPRRTVAETRSYNQIGKCRKS